ncbi:hypothetical protein [Sulfurimonas xiamenensis]|uniref:Uncharacterized protein n=1 Tax=Sulfurimonas xiamenensis TaxID=2590021 RepID=A0AAJ4A332_9BACT|nr:hypothetical protein [Sulfurimonas xiamenensis]QFR42883.1 hypothetical protein FJR47_02740 [Sulfurimonas xiamenensis]
MTVQNINLNTAIYEDLKNRYQKTTLNKKELAHELGVSVSAVNNYIVKGYGVPQYKKLGDAKNAKVVFPLPCVADYLSNVILVA